LTFLETVGVKNFFFFSQHLAFLEALAHAIRLVSSLYEKYLLGFFRQCLYFLKRYLATHIRKKLSHIWQPIMPKVQVENVEDEECFNFILLKCPTINKEFYISCCLTI